MNSFEGDMKRSAVRVIGVLVMMLVVATAMLIWLVGNEFESKNQLSEARVKLGELRRKSVKLDRELSARDLSLVKLREELEQSRGVGDVERETTVQGRNVLLARIRLAESEAEVAKNAAEAAKNELRHAIEQSQKIETDLKAQINQAKKSNFETETQGKKINGGETADAVALEMRLKETIQELSAAKAELLTLRQVSRVTRVPPSVTIPPAIPLPVRPLSSTRDQKPIMEGNVFGQIKAFDTKDQFVVIQLNTLEGVGIGDALVITRQGNDVGVLEIYRVAKHNIVFAALGKNLRDRVRVGDQVTLQ